MAATDIVPLREGPPPDALVEEQGETLTSRRPWRLLSTTTPDTAWHSGAAKKKDNNG